MKSTKIKLKLLKSKSKHYPLGRLSRSSRGERQESKIEQYQLRSSQWEKAWVGLKSREDDRRMSSSRIEQVRGELSSREDQRRLSRSRREQIRNEQQRRLSSSRREEAWAGLRSKADQQRPARDKNQERISRSSVEKVKGKRWKLEN